MERIENMDEDRVNAIITERLIQFHNAMIERGQIASPPRGQGIVTEGQDAGERLGERSE